jgi:hypothetical protein
MSSMLLLRLLAMSVLVFLASGALAQAQEIFPPILSSGLRDATATQTPVTGKPEQFSAVQPAFDAASLPPIASIGPDSNIRPFLDPGVPQELTRAALRRAWKTDPAIRDFVGLSENSGDFNTPDGVPGFGPPTTDGAGRGAVAALLPSN